MSDDEYKKEQLDEWFRKGDSDLRSAEILMGIEPRYPADIPISYSIEETKKAMELSKD